MSEGPKITASNARAIDEDFEGPVCTIPRNGEMLTISEEELTEAETDMLRVTELVNEMALAPVIQDIEDLENQLKFAQEELLKRSERIRHLSESDNKIFSGIAKMATDYFAGSLPADILTKKQFEELESIYVRTLPYATLDPDQEVQLRGMVRRVADKEFEKGEFGTLEAAREFYGLGTDIETEDEND